MTLQTLSEKGKTRSIVHIPRSQGLGCGWISNAPNGFWYDKRIDLIGSCWKREGEGGIKM